MATATGRTRTLTWEHEIEFTTSLDSSGRAEVDYSGVVNWFGEVGAAADGDPAQFGTALGTVWLGVSHIEEPKDPILLYREDTLGISYGIQFPDEPGVTIYGTTTKAADMSGTYSFTLTYSADVVEYMEVSDDPDNDADRFPGYGNSGGKDHLPGEGITFFEVIDGDVTISIAGDATYSRTTGTLDGTVIAAYDTYLNAQVQVGGLLGWMSNVAQSCSLAGTLERADPDVSLSESSGGLRTASLSAGALALSAARTTGGASSESQYAAVLGITGPQTEYDIAVVSRKFETTGPTVTCEWESKDGATETFSVNPSGSDSSIQRRVDISVTADSFTTGSTETVYERAPVRAWLTSASLSSAGEESADGRLQFRGLQWDAIEVEHDSHTFDSGDPANWAASSNGALSGTTTVRVDASGGSSGMTREFDPPAVPEAFRYLRIRVRGSDAMSLRLTLTGREREKRYALPVTSSWVNVDIDMMIPANAAGYLDNQDTRWPLKPPGDAEEYAPINEGWLFGVNWLTEIAISELPDGEWVEVDYVEGHVQDDVKLHVLPEYKNFVTRSVSGSDTTSDVRFVLADVDGKLGLDWFGLTRVSGSSTTYFWLPLGSGLLNLADYIAGIPGWTVSATAGPDAIHSLGGYAFWLGGSGATYDHGSDTWDYWTNLDPKTSALTIPAQALWDFVEVYPGAGEVWTGGDYDEATKLRAAKFLRGRAIGIVADAGAPMSGETVTLQEASWSDVDTETTDSRGRYETGTTHGQSGASHRVLWNDGKRDRIREWTAAQWVSRKWHRASFLLVEAVPGVAYAWHPAGHHARAVADESGDITVAVRTNESGATWVEKAAGLNAFAVSLAWLFAHNGPRLLMLTAGPDGARLHTSDDLGDSWTLASTLDTPSDPLGAAITVGADGQVFCYWLDGTTVKGAVLDSALTSLRTDSSIRTSVDPAGIAAATFVRGQIPRIALLTVESSAVTVTESTDGLTFS